MAVKVTVENITPEIADEMLGHNSRNPRKLINRSVVQKYADDISAGLWELNGDAIVFDEDGFLKNGQHRLFGVIKAGKPIRTVVVRGVPRNVTKWDIQYRRTLTQNVNADGLTNVNSNITSAARIIVNNFGRPVGEGIVEDYIRKNVHELERAYRCVCYGGTGHIISKCGPCIAAGYLALRTESIPSYELEVFFRRFNGIDTWANDGYDISPALVARKMFDERGVNRSGYQIQKEKLEIIVLGLQDFHNGNHVTDNYRIAEPFHYSEWMNDIRRKDGVEG
ncbi:MAG: hypothetical protein II602_06885 [Erysipelotrichales bacterium]|nr:hypothetical protein [Erysipelotrichales bacterium]